LSHRSQDRGGFAQLVGQLVTALEINNDDLDDNVEQNIYGALFNSQPGVF
jgi:hypothetical protein